ncbi:MAG: lysylphosphatidylglycerol synthase transmembrane domain-containing protein [Marmoricola sp.]
MKRSVRRWGGRAIGLTITGVGLYIVAPSVVALLDDWPKLERVRPPWFVLLVLLEAGSMAALWFLVRMTLPTTRWFTVASSQLAGNAASRILPGGNATGSVVQAGMLVRAGQATGAVAAAMGSIGLLTTGMLLALPILTVPAVIIRPPPARQLGLGLVVSLVVAVVLVGLGLALLKWDAFVHSVGKAAGYALHLVRPHIHVSGVVESVTAQRDVVAAAFAGRWSRALAFAAANRMLDYAALVASLYAVGARARPSMVLLAYVLALGLALVPITPGGLGFVEAGLTTVLVLAGVSSDQAVLGTLLYRLVSFWLPIPVGAFAWAGWRLHPSIARSG